MKLETIHLENLRSCKDVTIPLNAYTCLVGPNGAGKSTVLTALNIFFRENQQAGVDVTKLVQEDFHQKNTTEPITITLTFVDLSPEAQQDFKDYYRNGKLVITAEAVFDPTTQRADVQQYGERLVMQEFAKFFAAEGDDVKVPELKAIFSEIRQTVVPDLPAATTKPAMIQAMRDYETAHQDRCTLLRSKDEFYGISKGKNRLEKHVQWVYVPAVKDASTEQLEQRNTALARLLARTVRAKTKFTEQLDAIRQKAQQDYQTLLNTNQQTLNDLSTALQKRLVDWAHPEATLRVEWWQDPKAIDVQEPAAHIIAGEDTFEGQLCRLGHGLQRSYLLALLQELANTNDETAPELLLGCEEPELYQHPPQARHLFDVFQKLTADNAQVIVSTHSPHFVSGETFEDVRLIRKCPATKTTLASHVTFDRIATNVSRATGDQLVKPAGIRAKLQQALQANLNELFFAQRLILVEGLEDTAYLTAYLQLCGRWEDYRRLGCHMIPVGGKDQIIQPLAIAKALNIPTVVVFDSDADKYGTIDAATDPEGKLAARRPMHLRDNTAILILCGITTPDPFPAETLFHDSVVLWHSEIGSVVEEDIGAQDWRECKAQAERELGQPGGLEKNVLQIALRLAKAWDAGKRSTHLDQACDRILNTARPAVAQAALQVPAQAAQAHHAP